MGIMMYVASFFIRALLAVVIPFLFCRDKSGYDFMEAAGGLCRPRLSYPCIPSAYVFCFRVILRRLLRGFLAGCEEQAGCYYHDGASADGEDRGTDATGGRKGGKLGICNAAVFTYIC